MSPSRILLQKLTMTEEVALFLQKIWSVENLEERDGSKPAVFLAYWAFLHTYLSMSGHKRNPVKLGFFLESSVPILSSLLTNSKPLVLSVSMDDESVYYMFSPRIPDLRESEMQRRF